MKPSRLFVSEMRHRPGGLIIGAVAIAIAAIAAVASHAAVLQHDQATERELSTLQDSFDEEMAALNNETRKFTKHLGFDMLLLPEGQDRDEYLTFDRSRVYLDEADALRLVDAKLSVLNHITPILRGRFEQDSRELLVVGISGRIHIQKPKRQKPILKPMDPGVVILGASLANRFSAGEGDQITIGEHHLTVTAVLPARGNEDDLTALMNLHDAQVLLDKPGKVSAILGLSCLCESVEEALRLVSEGASAVLPGIQTVPFLVRAQARIRARTAVRDSTNAARDELLAARSTVRDQVSLLTVALTAVAGLGAAGAIAGLAMANARERRHEIALLRALGVGTVGVLGLLLGRCAVLGALGGILGGLFGIAVVRVFMAPDTPIALWWLGVLPVAGAIIAMLAAVVPALRTASRDPAHTLAEA